MGGIGLIMKLEDTTIYPFIRSDPALCKLHTFARGKYIIRVGEAADIWYLVNGKVQVETTTQNGKKLVVDTICEDNYVGHLSNFWGQNFYCDSYALVSSILIRIPKERFLKMMESLEFSRHFYMKTNARLYDMYKKELVRGLFSQRQQFAFYVIKYSQNNICRIHNLSGICEFLKITRRHFYNLLDRFSEDGIIKRLDDGDIEILDLDALYKVAEPVVNFSYNKM